MAHSVGRAVGTAEQKPASSWLTRWQTRGYDRSEVYELHIEWGVRDTSCRLSAYHVSIGCRKRGHNPDRKTLILVDLGIRLTQG